MEIIILKLLNNILSLFSHFYMFFWSIYDYLLLYLVQLIRFRVHLVNFFVGDNTDSIKYFHNDMNLSEIILN